MLIAEAGKEAVFVRTDVSSESEVQHMVDETLQTYGAIDILVNNAATFIGGRVEQVSVADWTTQLGTVVIGSALCAKHAVPAMRRGDRQPGIDQQRRRRTPPSAILHLQGGSAQPASVSGNGPRAL